MSLPIFSVFSVFFPFFLPFFLSVFFRFLSFFLFRFLPFSSVFFRFLPFFSVWRHRSRDPFCETPSTPSPGDDLLRLESVRKQGDRKSLSIAKNHPKTCQEFSEQFGPSTHKIKGFSKNSHQKGHPNFAKILGRQILGNTLSGPNRNQEEVLTGGSFRKGVRVPTGVPGGGVWGRVQVGGWGGFSYGKKGKGERGWGGWGVG